MHPTRPLLPLAALLALTLVPAAAHAGTAQVTGNAVPPSCRNCNDGGDTRQISFTAAPNETNDVVVSTARDGGYDVITFRDGAGPVAVAGKTGNGTGCVAQPDGSAVCTAVSALVPSISLGDSDDRASVVPEAGQRTLVLHGDAGNDVLSGGTAGDDLDGDLGDDTIDGAGGDDVIKDFAGANTLRGGPGDDQITGGRDADAVDGGEGEDLVHGGGGAGDVLRGGAGDDALFDDDKSGATNADTLDGGDGRDVLDLLARTAPLTIDLEKGAGGERGEGDRFAGLETLLGGSKSDRLTGDGSANLIDGRSGKNTIEGRGGNDVLIAEGDRATCGAGVDLVTQPGAKQLLGRDCERVTPGNFDTPVGRPTLRGGTLVFTVPCPRDEDDDDVDSCVTTVKVGPSGSWGAGTARKRVRAGKSASVAVRLTATGLKDYKARKRMRVDVHQQFNDDAVEDYSDDGRYVIAL